MTPTKSQTTTPIGADVDVLAVLNRAASFAARGRLRAPEYSARQCAKENREDQAAIAAVAALISRNAELEADAGRWREVSDKAWLIDAAAYAYGLRTGTFDPTPEEDEVIAAVDAARTPAKENGDA